MDAISIPLLIEQLRQQGWVMLPPLIDGIGRMRDMTTRLCRSLVPGLGRESYRQQFPEGDLHHAPVGRSAVLGHSERAYSPQGLVPDLCFFLCLDSTPLEHGGHLTLADGERLLQALPAELAARLRSMGVNYHMQWDRRRWQEEFQISSKQELNAWLASRADLTYQWDRDELLIRWHTCALRSSWTSGREAFANGILAHLPAMPDTIHDASTIYCKATNNLSWGDGSELTQSEIIAMIQAHENSRQIMTMQSGQILIIDNTRILHGRTTALQEVGHETLCRFGLRALHL